MCSVLIEELVWMDPGEQTVPAYLDTVERGESLTLLLECITSVHLFIPKQTK